MNIRLAGWVSAAAALILALFAPVFPAAASPVSTIHVPADFPTIQAAIDAAPQGATIEVGPGTYTEQIVLTKDVTLQGSGVTSTVIKAPSNLTPFGLHLLSQRPVAAVVRVGHAAHVRISGLGVTGPLPCGLVTGVLATQGATLDLAYAQLTDMMPAATDCPQPPSNRAVAFGLPPFIVIDGAHGTNAFGRVSHVNVNGYLTEGLTATGRYNATPTDVTFADNVVRPGDPLIPTEQFAINVVFGAVARVTGNTVVGAACTLAGCGSDPLLAFQSAGVFAAGAGQPTVIVDNHVSNTDIGIYQLQSPLCCRIASNVLIDNRFFGIVIQDGDGTTNDNTIRGGEIGIGVAADASDTTAWLRGDRISSTTVSPVRELECCGFTATAIRSA